MKYLTWWQRIKLTFTGREARAAYFDLERDAGDFHDDLEDAADPRERAQLLFKLASCEREQVPLQIKGWRADLEEDVPGVSMAQAGRYASVLYKLLADVEQAVAYPHLGRRERTTDLERCAGDILDRMAATPDLDERMAYLGPLYWAVHDKVGSTAAEVVACIPWPARTENAA